LTPADAVTRRLLREALDRRRREVAALLAAGVPGREAGVARGDPGAAFSGGRAPAQEIGVPDPEETLRRFMVAAWPAARDRGGDPGARAAFLDLLARLEPQARSDDLRFLDAWNNAFETIAAWPRDLQRAAGTVAILRAYAALLEHHLRRLANGP
jgi:hypothetical protein